MGGASTNIKKNIKRIPILYFLAKKIWFLSKRYQRQIGNKFRGKLPHQTPSPSELEKQFRFSIILLWDSDLEFSEPTLENISSRIKYTNYEVYIICRNGFFSCLESKFFETQKFNLSLISGNIIIFSSFSNFIKQNCLFNFAQRFYEQTQTIQISFNEFISSEINAGLVIRRNAFFKLIKKKEISLSYSSWSNFLDEINKPNHEKISKTILVFPDYRKTNPYQTMVYEGLPTTEHSFVFTSNFQKIFEPGNEFKVLHVHWTAPFWSKCECVEDAKARLEYLNQRLKVMVDQGVKIFWYIHNFEPHFNKFPEQDLAFRVKLGEISWRVVLLSPAKIEEIISRFQINPEKILISPHPHYIGHYNRKDNIQLIPFKKEKITLLFLGQIRAYKGLSEILSFLKKYKELLNHLRFIVAGRPVFPSKVGDLSKILAHRNIIYIEREILDEEIFGLYSVSDYVILPFKKILNSGSTILSLSMGVPVIAPPDGSLPYYIISGVNGYLYRDEKELEKTLTQIVKSFKTFNKKDVVKTVEQFSSIVLQENFDCLTVSDGETHLYFTYLSECFGKLQIEIINKLDGIEITENHVAVVILNFENYFDTIRLVSSLRRSTYTKFSIFILDNASTNNSFNILKNSLSNTCLIRIPSNVGYACGNNIGLYLAKTLGFKLFWILNPDICVEPNSLQCLVENYSPKEILGSRITKNGISNHYWFEKAAINLKEVGSVSHLPASLEDLKQKKYNSDYVTGAGLFFDIEVLKFAGYLPEQFFLYFEETAWCAEAASKGISVKVSRDSILHHFKRSESGDFPKGYFIYYYVRNRTIFFKSSNKPIDTSFEDYWRIRVGKHGQEALQHFEKLLERAKKDGYLGYVGKMEFINELQEYDLFITDMLYGTH